MRHLIILRPLALALSLCGLPAAGHGVEQRVSCPALLQPDAIQPKNPPAGWVLHMPQQLNLTEGGMLQGSPDQSAYMVPTDSANGKSGKYSTVTMRWTFPAPEGDELWMYCGYGGAGAPLKLFRRVAAHATGCILSSKSTNGRTQEAVEFICR